MCKKLESLEFFGMTAKKLQKLDVSHELKAQCCQLVIDSIGEMVEHANNCDECGLVVAVRENASRYHRGFDSLPIEHVPAWSGLAIVPREPEAA